MRIDVNSGDVLGEYLTSSDGRGRDPSRTTVDQLGSVWVANRAEFENGMGSIVRVGLIIGGTRVAEDGTPDPTGDYLAPLYMYNTCEDRDSDGRIRTSGGLVHILSWTN